MEEEEGVRNEQREKTGSFFIFLKAWNSPTHHTLYFPLI